ncbi:MAG: hypothetical protein KBT35_05880 [Firmicutes bacterium]|nr:hypothetical protein [Candidatus Colivicinus equi]
MAYKVQKPCKVCGKMYTPCGDCENDKSAFHWRTVACSIGCGKKYFELVEKERNKNTTDIINVEPIEEIEDVDEDDNKMLVDEFTTIPKYKKKKEYKNFKEREQID